MDVGADTIKEGAAALETAARGNNFAVLIAVAGVVALGFMAWDVNRRADAQVAALSAITIELQAHGAVLKRIDEWCCAPVPAGRGASYRGEEGRR